MDQTLLKYWKTCLQDAERKAIALKGPRITLNIDDKILKFIPLKSIPVIFPDWKAEDSNEKQKVMIAPCILLPEFENGWTSQSERPEYPFLITATMYNPQIQISAESETKRSIFREKDKTKRSKKESAQHSKSRNKSFVMTSVSAL